MPAPAAPDTKDLLRRALHEARALPYLPAVFAGRQDEFKQIMDLLQRLEVGERPRIRTFFVSGEKGAGKTWFMRNIHEMIRSKKSRRKITSVYITFDESNVITPDQSMFAIQSSKKIAGRDRGDGEQLKSEVNEPILTFLKELAPVLQARTAPDATLQEQSYWLALKAEDMQDRIMVLLLDSVSMAPAPLLDALEEQWLKHLVRLPNVLVVTSGRGDMPGWTSPELREVEKLRLPPFPRTSAEDQIGLDRILDGTNAYLQTELGKTSNYLPFRNQLDTIYQTSGGFPYSAYFLALRGPEHLAGLIDVLLGFVPEDSQSIITKSNVRSYLEAICVLNPWRPDDDSDTRFRKEHMQPLLEVYFGRPFNMPEVRSIARKLQDLKIMRWERGASGYTIDSALRFPIAYALQADAQKWRTLHCAAATMFEQIAIKFTESEEYYTMLARPHSQICGKEQESRRPAKITDAS